MVVYNSRLLQHTNNSTSMCICYKQLCSDILNHGIIDMNDFTACSMMFPQYIIVCMVWTLLYFAVLCYIIFLCYP